MAKLRELPGSGPVNRSEREVVALLAGCLPGDYWLIPNVSLSERNGRSWEFDIIVVAPHACYVVEIKNWHGAVVQLNSAEWRLSDGTIKRNPLDVNAEKARVLGSLLDRMTLTDSGGRALRRPYVHDVLIAASDRTRFELFQDQQSRAIVSRHACSWLQSPSHLPHCRDPRRYAEHTKVVAAFIVGELQPRDRSGRTFGSYRTTSIEAATDDTTTYLATHAQFDDGGVYRVRTWFVSQYRLNPAERAARVEVLRRSATALRQLRDEPNVVRLEQFGDDDGEFYEVTEWSERGTLATALSRQISAKARLAAKLEILRGIARGLAAAHAHGIHHRNLTPGAILLSPDGTPRIAGFDYASLADASVTVYDPSAQAVDNPYRAPELRDPDGYDSFATTDVFSLGVIAYELLTAELPPGLDTGDRPPPVSNRGPRMAESAQQVLDPLVAAALSHGPADRPSLEEFVASLDALLAPDCQAPIATPVAGPTAGDEAKIAPEPAPKIAIQDASRQARHDEGQYEEGESITANHIVRGVLGRGTSATVYEVRNEALQSDFALKLFTRGDLEQDAAFREFRLLRRISHGHVVRAHWADRQTAPPHRPYVLMERLDGEPLAALLASGRDIALNDALGWTRQILTALDALHHLPAEKDGVPAGVTHRDISPQNVFITGRGAVLADLGVAGPLGPDDRAPVGSPRYSPPDLPETGWVAAADTFAVGALLFRMVTGRDPWGVTPPTMLAASVPELPHGAPRGLARLLGQAVAPHAADRFTSAAEFITALDALGSTEAPAIAAPEHPGTRIATEVRRASERLWDAGFVQALGTQPHWEDVVFPAMLGEIRAASVGGHALEDAFVESEARLATLERPLPTLAGTFYEELLAAMPPRPALGDAEPGPWRLDQDQTLLVVEPLMLFELVALDGVAGWTFDRLDVWRAAVGASGSAALSAAFENVPELMPCGETPARGGRAHHVQLGAGRVGDDLAGLLEQRRARLEALMHDLAADLATVSVVITTTTGGAYLGHGLREDVGSGRSASQADRARAAWARTFGSSRWADSPEDLPAPPGMLQPTRRHHDRHFVVGRLAWPDGPDTPLVRTGGLSLAERLWPLARMRRLNA